MNENPVLFWIIWLLLQKKKKTPNIHVIFERIAAPAGLGGTVGTPKTNGRKDEYNKYLVAKIYCGDEYLGWFTLATYYPAWGYCIYYNTNGAEYIETKPSGSSQYQVAKTVFTINSISAEYTSNYAIQMHQKYDSIQYSLNDAILDETHIENDFSTTFNLNPVEQTYGDENISGGTVNMFGDGLTLKTYKEVFKDFKNATFGFSNGGTEE